MKINAFQKTRYEKAGYWTNASLLDRWHQSSEIYAKKEFIADDIGNRYTYEMMDRKASVLAAWLNYVGVRPGEVVSFQLPPRAEFVVIAIACLKVGAIMAPLGMCFADDELAELLNSLSSKVHFSPAGYRGANRRDMLEAVRQDVPLLSSVVLLGEGEGENGVDGFVSFKKIMTGFSPLQSTIKIHGNQLAVLLCTSGTTRKQQMVMLTHNNIIFSEDGFNRELMLTEKDVIFMPSPLSHATGFHHGIISPMLAGGKIVLQEKFCCRQAIEIMNRERCTYSMGATSFFCDILRELENEKQRLNYLRFYLCGGAPVPAEMVSKAWSDFGIRLCEVYGSTESVPHTLVRPHEVLSMNNCWSGRAIEGVEIRVVDENRKEVPQGEIGEEASRGPNVFVGYFNDPVHTDQVLDDEGWYYSGDLCISDASGNIKIVGRKKDLIIRGGENLNADAIDHNLEGCPGVEDHAVIGMPDERLGERICAYVVQSPDTAPLSLEQIIRYLRGKRVPKRYWPEHLEIIGSIPRTESGKVQKYLLVKELKLRMSAQMEAMP